MNLLPELPFPKNEPENAYKPGTADYDALQKALANREVVDVPTVIGGKEYFSNDVEEIRSPHDRSRVVARIHRPTAAQHREAITSSIKSAAEWAALPFQSRAAVMLRVANVSRSTTTRPRTGAGSMPSRIRMASIACIAPRVPGTGPSTPASAQFPTRPSRGASGHRQRRQGQSARGR